MGDRSSGRYFGDAKPRGRLAQAMNQGSGSNWRGNNGGWQNAGSGGQCTSNDTNWRGPGGNTRGHGSQPRMSAPPVVEEDWDADIQEDQYSSSTKQTQCLPPEAHQIDSWEGRTQDDSWGKQDQQHVQASWDNWDQQHGGDASCPEVERSGMRQDGGRGRNGGFSSGRKTNEQSSSSTIEVPSYAIGRIIGKKGAKIRELEEESGARIKVEEEENSGQKVVKLHGDADALSKAKMLIQDIVSSASDRGRGPNQRDQYQPPRQNCSDSHSGFQQQSSYAFSDLQQHGSCPQNEEKESSVTEDSSPFTIDWDAFRTNSIFDRRKKWKNFPEIKKDFYHEDPTVAALSDEDIERIREENNNIVVKLIQEGDEKVIPNPVWTFEQAFSHYPDILEEIYKQRFEKPSPIQCQAWPVLLKGYDLIGIAQTGTGKTLAFLLPALIHIDSQPIPREKREGPSCLILAPTRELALQIEGEVKKYNYHDRMLDMGFEPQIRKILLDIHPDAQRIMTSATWPEGVRRLAGNYVEAPIQVFIGTLDLRAVESVFQLIEILTTEEKFDRLCELLGALSPEDKALVFVGKKATAAHICTELLFKGLNVSSIHGDHEQSDREQTLQDFRDGSIQILIGTDLVSRGIDVLDITHIINYDFPRDIEEYVHRVGRTGRAGRTGVALSLFTREDWRQAAPLIKILEKAQQEVPDELHDMAERFRKFLERREAEHRPYRGRDRYRN
ncbi:unnamed protein product [Darwinula stevensoni]|uniref:RNA helicase n=1 Tax=Darwinula stevensoni TaxID=69355 RepID=A0A7R9A285_9CRUS|nr:unnamed protein product [Darwinula stevensoni]CAG0885174.1 unnamed protein product [Darwinula stevensoni]